MNIISPRFYSKLPKDWKEWSQPGHENVYRACHPVAYRVFGVIGLFCFLLPIALVVYVFAILSRSGVEIFGPLGGIGALGAVLVGSGLVSIVAAFTHQYFGHFFTLITLLAGMFLLVITFWLVTI